MNVPHVVQELFMSAARVLVYLTQSRKTLASVAANVAAVKQMAAVFQILSRKLENERKYLARLEGESSWSICNSTA